MPKPVVPLTSATIQPEEVTKVLCIMIKTLLPIHTSQVQAFQQWYLKGVCVLVLL